MNYLSIFLKSFAKLNQLCNIFLYFLLYNKKYIQQQFSYDFTDSRPIVVDIFDKDY